MVLYDLEQRRLIEAEITRRTIDFMQRSVKATKPFYAHVPFTLVHFPTLPNPSFAGKTGHEDFPDCLAETDAHVGELLDAVNQLGIREKTIFVFTSDNGPDPTQPWQGTSGPWRGFYFTHMEGIETAIDANLERASAQRIETSASVALERYTRHRVHGDSLLWFIANRGSQR